MVCMCLLAALIPVAPAQAQSVRSRILRECQDGRLTGDYTAEQIRDARKNIPDDIDQYSDCRDVLSRALQSVVGGSGSDGAGGGGGGGAGGAGGGDAGGGGGGALLTPATDDDRRALEEATARGGEPVEVGGRPITPGAAGVAARNSVPSTLIVVLVLLAAMAAVGSAPFVRRHGPATATALLRRVLPSRSG
jgi:hypothetical protein